MDLLRYSATELIKMVKEGNVQIKDILDCVFLNIDEKNSDINAFISIDREGAYERAKEIQNRIDNGERVGILAGMPVAIKDNISVKNFTVTCGSKILKDYNAVYSATAIERLLEEDAIIVGKTNMDEFGMGSTTTNSYFGATKNPVNKAYITGGSSGGSCAAVASNMSIVALGSDTGGSVRQPAAYCGLVGIKPTYGTVSRYGLVAYASSLEQIGVIGKNVSDCAYLLETIAGYDSKDSTSVKRENYDFTRELSGDVNGMKIALPKEYFTDDLEPEICIAVKKAAEELAKKGAIVKEINLNYVEQAAMAYYVIACAEASSNLARYDGVKYGYRTENYNDLSSMYENTRNEGFGEEVKKRIKLGEYVLSSGFYDEHYLKALKVRRLIKDEFNKHFSEFDAILAPVTKCGPVKLSDKIDEIKMYMDDLYTVPANLCGFPAISIPFDVDKNNMPVGVQIIGKCFDEKSILKVACALEESR